MQAYSVGMPTSQYTVRNIPPRLDRALRKRASLSGKSLNRLIIEDLAAQAGVPVDGSVKQNLAEQLDWFIGSGIDDGTLQALAEEDKAQKQLMARKLGLDS